MQDIEERGVDLKHFGFDEFQGEKHIGGKTLGWKFLPKSWTFLVIGHSNILEFR